MKTLHGILTLSLFFGAAAQAQLSFTWSGTYDDNGTPTPFEITYTTERDTKRGQASARLK